MHRGHKGDAQAFSHASRGAEGPGFRQELARAFVICGEAQSIVNPAGRARGCTEAGPTTWIVGSHPAPHARAPCTCADRTDGSNAGF